MVDVQTVHGRLRQAVARAVVAILDIVVVNGAGTKPRVTTEVVRVQTLAQGLRQGPATVVDTPSRVVRPVRPPALFARRQVDTIVVHAAQLVVQANDGHDADAASLVLAPPTAVRPHPHGVHAVGTGLVQLATGGVDANIAVGQDLGPGLCPLVPSPRRRHWESQLRSVTVEGALPLEKYTSK